MSGTDCKALWGKKCDPSVCLIYGVSSWILCFCMHISMNSHPHTHTQMHTRAALCSATSVGWPPFKLAPGCSSSSGNSTRQPQSLSSSEPISWQCTHTILSTNCLSISPVPANYQLLMNGSPYRAERPMRGGKGEERAGLRVRRGGEESTADCYYLNKLTALLWYYSVSTTQTLLLWNHNSY